MVQPHARGVTSATKLVRWARNDQPGLSVAILLAELGDLPEPLTMVDRLLDDARFLIPSRDHFRPNERTRRSDEVASATAATRDEHGLPDGAPGRCATDHAGPQRAAEHAVRGGSSCAADVLRH